MGDAYIKYTWNTYVWDTLITYISEVEKNIVVFQSPPVFLGGHCRNMTSKTKNMYTPKVITVIVT